MAAAKRYALDVPAGALSDVTNGGALPGTYLLNLVNRGAQDTQIQVAVTEGGTPTAADFIEYGETLPANGKVLARWSFPLGSGWKVWVQSTFAGVSATLIGRQEV